MSSTPTSIRATLKPYLVKERGKWYARGTYPVRDVNGIITRKRGFVGHGSDTRVSCQAECDRLSREIERAINSGPIVPTFAEAALVYLKLGGDARFMTDKMLSFLGPYHCDQIDDAVMVKAAETVYPTCSPATINRQLYTPVVAVLRLASKKGEWKMQVLQRPKGYSKLKPAKSPADDWFDKVLPAAPGNLRAILLISTLHGFRVGELIRLKPTDFDPSRKTIQVRMKNGETVVEVLAGPALDALLSTPWREGPGLFGTLTDKNRRGVFRMLERLCKSLGVQYFPPHKIGRHAFAKRLLAAGYSLAHVKAAGRWNSMRPLAELYGAYEHSEVADAARATGEEWAKKIAGTPTDNVVRLPTKKTGTQ